MTPAQTVMKSGAYNQPGNGDGRYVQNAASGANDLATAQAEAEAAQATAEALQKSQDSSDADIATSQAQVEDIQATVDAVAATATVIYEKAGLNSIDQGYAEISIQVDAEGLLAGDEDAINDAKDAISEAMVDYTDCRVGISLTFGWDPDVGTGTQIADIINGLLPEVEPEMFEDAAYQNFANIGPTGTVDFQLYFFRGCNALDE